MGSAICQMQVGQGNAKWQAPSLHYQSSNQSLRWKHPLTDTDIVYSTEASCKKNSTVKNIIHWDTIDSTCLYKDGTHSASSWYVPYTRQKSIRLPVDGNEANIQSYMVRMNDVAGQLETEGLRIEYVKRPGCCECNLVTEGEHSQSKLLGESPLSKEAGTSFAMTSDGLKQRDSDILQKKWKNLDVISAKSSGNCIPEGYFRESHENVSREDETSSIAYYSDNYSVKQAKDFNIRLGSRFDRSRYESKNGDKKHQSTQEEMVEGSLNSEKSSTLTELESYDSEWRENYTDHSINDDLSSSWDESESKGDIFEKTGINADKNSASSSPSSMSWVNFNDKIKNCKREDEYSSIVRSEHEPLKISTTKHDWSKGSQKKLGKLDIILAKAKTNSADIKSLITWDDILKYKQRLQCKTHGIFHGEEQLKKLKHDADNEERLNWKTWKNGRRTTPDGVETIDVKSLILKSQQQKAIQRMRKEDSQSWPFPSSNTSNSSREVQLSYPIVRLHREEKMIYHKTAPMFGYKTLAWSTQSSCSPASLKTTFIPKKITKETFFTHTDLRVNKCLAASANTVASPSSCKELRTVLDGSKKILTNITKVKGDERTSNKRLRSKNQFLGHPLILRREKEISQDVINGTDQLCTTDGTHRRLYRRNKAVRLPRKYRSGYHTRK